jgi:aspartyl/glutamyl-tRNA(Asn/Gln) amidotransferase C subunit
VDTSDAVTATPLDLTATDHIRDDEPAAGLDRDDALRCAPDTTGGFFRVPPVIDRGDGG